MKKILISVSLLFLLSVCFLTKQVVLADSTTNSAITSPDQTTYSRSPGYNDTYFTYYTSIIGYKSNGLWGFYSRDGFINIPPMYTDIEALDSKYIKVKRNGVWGLIDTSGYQIFQPAFDSIETISVGTGTLFKVKQYGMYGVIDLSGNVLVPLRYQSIYKLDNTYLEVTQNYMHGVYSIYEAKEIISAVYEDIKLLNKWFMFEKNGKWGLLDKAEKVIVSANYDDIKFLNNSYFTVKNNKVWGTVNLNGEVVIPLKYDKIEVGKAQYLKIKHNGKWGACTYDGKVVISTDKGPLEINRLIKQLY